MNNQYSIGCNSGNLGGQNESASNSGYTADGTNCNGKDDINV